MTHAEPDALDVALLVAAALERIGIDYFLGGSLASSMQGEPRATNDIDVIADIAPWKVEALIQSLGPDFDVDADALREALRRGASWNFFYTPVFLKIDLFPVGDGLFDRSEFARRQRVVVRRDGAALFVKSPEDTVLRKLLWYRDGGEVSAKQWRDIVEVLRVCEKTLDDRYLDEWGRRLGIEELLGRARREASPI
jgi:hypothetical protein